MGSFGMEYRQLGNTNVEVSALSLGSWLTYEFMAEKDALAVLGSAIEAGVNFLDDARYDDRSGHAPMKSGYSEVVFGRLLRKGGWNRTDLVIANKLWYEFYPQESPEEELEGSLSRLQMDYMDLVYCERPPGSLPVAEVVRQMDDLIKSGKLRQWGILNWSAEQIEEAWRVATREGLMPPCAAQLPYSLLNRFPVEDGRTRQVFDATGVRIVASYSLHGGLLTGKYSRDETVVAGRFGAEEVESMRKKKLMEKVDEFISLAQELSCTPAQLALAFCLKNEQVVSVLFGATKVSQVEENIGAIEVLPLVNQQVVARLRVLD